VGLTSYGPDPCGQPGQFGVYAKVRIIVILYYSILLKFDRLVKYLVEAFKMLLSFISQALKIDQNLRVFAFYFLIRCSSMIAQKVYVMISFDGSLTQNNVTLFWHGFQLSYSCA